MLHYRASYHSSRKVLSLSSMIMSSQIPMIGECYCDEQDSESIPFLPARENGQMDGCGSFGILASHNNTANTFLLSNSRALKGKDFTVSGPTALVTGL